MGVHSWLIMFRHAIQPNPTQSNLIQPALTPAWLPGREPNHDELRPPATAAGRGSGSRPGGKMRSPGISSFGDAPAGPNLRNYGLQQPQKMCHAERVKINGTRPMPVLWGLTIHCPGNVVIFPSVAPFARRPLLVTPSYRAAPLRSASTKLFWEWTEHSLQPWHFNLPQPKTPI